MSMTARRYAELWNDPYAAYQAGRRPLEIASDWLARLMLSGPKPAADLLRAARLQGCSARTLYRAKRLNGIRSFRCNGRWFWIEPVVVSENPADRRSEPTP